MSVGWAGSLSINLAPAADEIVVYVLRINPQNASDLVRGNLPSVDEPVSCSLTYS